MNHLEEILRPMEMKVVPPKIASDGSLATPAHCLLSFESTIGRSDKLFEFVGSSCGELLAINIEPLRADPTDDPILEWKGHARVGPASCKPPGKDETVPRVKFSIIVEAGKDCEELMALVRMRLFMISKESRTANVRMALEQARLEFGEEAPEEGK